jgi:hypothetical protein
MHTSNHAVETVTAAGALDVIVCAHHPELARRPEPAAVRAFTDATRVALTWNVFRTLELVSPPFWLRRLRARLAGLSHVDPAPEQMRVQLWPALERARAGGAGTAGTGVPAVVDVLVDTETAVYGVITLYRSDIFVGATSATQVDPLLAAVEAVSWYAGVRDCYIAVITSDALDSPVARSRAERYSLAHDNVARRLAHRRDGLANVKGIGWLTWRDMASIVRDCSESLVLDDFQRYAAGRARQWLASIGIRPVD